MIERAVIYFNMYAFCYVSAYGFDFISSGKKVTALFQRRQAITKHFFVYIQYVCMYYVCMYVLCVYVYIYVAK